MDTLGGYIASFILGVAAKYADQFLRPKVKIRYWQSHSFVYAIPGGHAPGLAPPAPPAGQQPAPPNNFLLLAQSMTIQNFGRERTQWVEIVHQRAPDFFQLHPALNFAETTAPNGQHTLTVQSLAPKEFFTIQFLCYTHMPQLMHVRSTEGYASPMPWMVVRKYPGAVYALMWLAMTTGVGLFLYWIIRAGMHVFKGA